MKTFMLIFALSFAAAAQTNSNVSGITLSGPLNDLTITNNSTKPIVAAMVIYFDADGKKVTGDRHMFILDRPNYLAVGDSERLGTFYKGRGAAPVVSAQVAAVIFSDGEFRGVDNTEAPNFTRGMEERFQAMKAVFHLAQSRDWDKIKALYDADVKGDIWKAAVAGRLLRAHNNGGDAINEYKHYGNLPSTTWTGGLLNRLRVPNVFQAIAGGQKNLHCCSPL